MNGENISKMPISVIIPTYKSPKALDLCLLSAIEGQENKNQIIVVVDGYYDINKEVLERWSGFIDILNLEENVGGGFARVSASSGSSIVMSVLDSPVTTSAITYQVYIRETSAVANLSLNWTGITGTITAMEISG